MKLIKNKVTTSALSIVSTLYIEYSKSFPFIERKLAKLKNIILYDKKGGATLEVVIVSAVLIAIALLFNDSIREYATNLFNAVFNQSVISKLEY